MDAKILETRLLLRESTVASINISKCATRLATLRRKRSSADISVSTSAYDSYAADILLYQTEMNKVARFIDVCDLELKEYEDIQAAIEVRSSETEATIRRLETQLEEEKMIRKHKKLLEKLAGDVNSIRSRSKLNKEIQTAEDELRGVQDSLTIVDQNIVTRRAQYDSLVACIDALKRELVDENTKTVSGAITDADDLDDIAGDDDEDGTHDRRRGRDDDVAVEAAQETVNDDPQETQDENGNDQNANEEFISMVEDQAAESKQSEEDNEPSQQMDVVE